MKTAVLICWMACSGPGALAGDGGHDQNVPVEVGLRSMEISCRESGGEDEQAVAGDLEIEELLVKVSRRWGERWLLEVMLWNDKDYRIAAWELMDGDGKPLKTSYVNDIVSGDPECPGTGQYMTVDANTGLSKLKIRLYYREDMGTVSLPVDMKMGLDGTVRE